jgi:ABC-2 type transport system permease protein
MNDVIRQAPELPSSPFPLPHSPFPPAGGLLFQRLRWRMARNSWRLLFHQSTVRPLTIVVCSLVVWVFVFGVSFGGFQFLRTEVKLPPDGAIVSLLLDLLFLALGFLLIFSSGLILYASLFTAAETNFLLSKPVAADQVFAYKFQGALAFSSWAFLLLGGPVLIAYGLVCNSPWYFYALLPLFFLGFILMPGSVGAMGCLLVVNYFPRRRKQVLGLCGAVVAVLVGWWVYRLIQAAHPSSLNVEAWGEALTRLLGRFGFARNDLNPSHWVARGLRSAGRGKIDQALFDLGLVWSNGLFLYLIAAWVSRWLYRRGYNRLATGGTLRRRYGGHRLDHILQGALPFVDPSTRLLIVKDFRTFRRDPQQWGQILLFCGLMALYFTNIRRMFVFDITWNYQNSISLLNLCAISLLLCTYTGRFIYPMLSLEGSKFWILGLLPVRREQLLWGKFAFATTGGLLIAEALMLLSDLMLEMRWSAVLLHLLTIAVLAAGLSGLSVGLGACMPNFRETDPSKIAVGFGGTLNLIAGLLFLLIVLSLMAAPWHLQMALAQSAKEDLSLFGLTIVAGAALVGLVVGAMAVVLPLDAGIRALRRMEF